MKMAQKCIFLLICLVLVNACQKKQPPVTDVTRNKLVVVATLFPLYDFARAVGGDKADISLILPPGIEAHSFEPKPQDAVRVANADLFIITNNYMEPWAEKFATGLNSKKVVLVDASRGVTFHKAASDSDPEHNHGTKDKHDHSAAMDPHIWLDFSNARIMVDNIADAMSSKDPVNKNYYAARALAFKTELSRLDEAYKQGLSSCNQHVFLHGGHYTFGYLASRYGLQYESASAVNADAEPSPATLIALIRQVKALGLKYVFSEELLSPRISEMIAREAGVSILMLHGAHNISKDDMNHGTSFITLMNKNLANLKIGLDCK